MVQARRRGGARLQPVVRAGASVVSTTADPVWAVGRPTIGTAVKLAARIKIYGRERVPLTGGLVIACNHFHGSTPPHSATPARAR